MHPYLQSCLGQLPRLCTVQLKRYTGDNEDGAPWSFGKHSSLLGPSTRSQCGGVEEVTLTSSTLMSQFFLGSTRADWQILMGYCKRRMGRAKRKRQRGLDWP